MKSTRSFTVHGIPPNCSLSVSQSVSHSLLITLIAACAIVKKIGFFSFVKICWVLVQWDFKIWYFFFLILISINRYVMVFIESWSILDVQFIHFSLFWDIVSMEGHHSVTNPALQLTDTWCGCVGIPGQTRLVRLSLTEQILPIKRENKV